MNFARRSLLQLSVAAATGAALPTVPRIAWAQSYPSRPVRIVVGYPAGGSPDIVARLIGQSLSERLGHPFVIENRPGAGSNIAAESVVRSPADGYTLLLVTSANSTNATLYEKLNFDFIRDIEPVAIIVRAPLIMVVDPSSPAETVPEFIAYAKANPGKLNYAGAGVVPHISGELFKMMADVNMLYVPYRGPPAALTDLLSGQLHMMFTVIPFSIGYVRSGKLRALAVTTATRFEALPDIPTVAEFVPGFEASAVAGIGVPKGTAVEIVEKLNKQINLAIADPKIRAQLADLGATVHAGSPSDFTNIIADETERLGKVIRAANIKAE